MKTEQFSKVEHLVETTCDELDKLYDGLNILKQLPEIISASIPSHIERDLNCCYNSNKRAQVVKYLDLTCRFLKLNVCRTQIQQLQKR